MGSGGFDGGYWYSARPSRRGITVQRTFEPDRVILVRRAFNSRTHIDKRAQQIVTAPTAKALAEAWQQAHAASQTVLILGEGSNVLFLDDFNGTVILNRIMGIQVEEQPDAWLIHKKPQLTYEAFLPAQKQKPLSGAEGF
ncbi:FAD-binding protein, partial [Cronobacter universalis]|nr:FAD-binding protein [Cronobacter universalis]